MKIVFVVPDMIGGGTERMVSLLSNEYVKRGIEVAVLVFAGNTVEYKLDERVEVVIIGGPSKGNPFIRLKRLKAMRDYYKKNPDCIIFAFSVMGDVFSEVATIGMRHRILASERSDPDEYEHRWIRDFCYRRADRVVLQTEDVLKSFDKKIQKKAVVIPNPIDPTLPPVYTGKRKKKICAAARLEPPKDHKTLINAFYAFQKDFPEYTLEIYGRGTLENELKQMVQELGIADKVNFHGFCITAREEMRDSMMYVLPSKFEGISNALIESLSMGIPVIATDCPVGGTRMCIKDHENGLMIPVGDEKAMENAMREIASDLRFAEKISENGAKMRTRFSIETIGSEFLECIGLKEEQ